MLVRRIPLLALLTLALAAPAAALDFSISGGVDFNGSFSARAIGDVDVDGDAETGYTLGLEIDQNLGPMLELGLGAEYLFPRGFEREDVRGDAQFVTVYAVARVHFVPAAYIVGRFGWSDLSVDELTAAGRLDEKGGRHWGAGLGVSLLDKLKLEALWTNFRGELRSDIGDSDLEYEAVAVRVIYSF